MVVSLVPGVAGLLPDLHLGGALAVVPLLNPFARVPVCGLVSTYNATELPPGPNRMPLLMRAVLTKRLTLRGFIVSDFFAKQPEFLREATTWLKEGRITYCEDIVEGLENAPGALIGLLKGENFGKVVVHGHTPIYKPDIQSNRINIDTGAYATGQLTCLVLEGDSVTFLERDVQ